MSSGGGDFVCRFMREFLSFLGRYDTIDTGICIGFGAAGRSLRTAAKKELFMDGYYEQSVRRTKNKNDDMMKVLVWVGATFATVAAFFIFVGLSRFIEGWSASYPVALLAALLFYMYAALFTKRLSAEYEYILVEDRLTVDRILPRGGRKNLTEVCFKDALAFGVYTGELQRRYAKGKEKPYYTYTVCTGTPGNVVWYIYFSEKGRKKLILFEPDEKMLDMIKAVLPRELRILAFELGAAGKTEA